jgi:hypothetical protein
MTTIFVLDICFSFRATFGVRVRVEIHMHIESSIPDEVIGFYQFTLILPAALRPSGLISL